MPPGVMDPGAAETRAASAVPRWEAGTTPFDAELPGPVPAAVTPTRGDDGTDGSRCEMPSAVEDTTG